MQTDTSGVCLPLLVSPSLLPSASLCDSVIATLQQQRQLIRGGEDLKVSVWQTEADDGKNVCKKFSFFFFKFILASDFLLEREQSDWVILTGGPLAKLSFQCEACSVL